MQLNGVSRHDGNCTETCNENNEGLGIEIRENNNQNVDIYAVGTMINSENDRSWYVGLAKANRFGSKQSVSIGAFLGMIYYPTSTWLNGFVPAVLPFLSVDMGMSRFNVLYIPPVSGNVAAAWFFQVVIPLQRENRVMPAAN